MANVKFIHTADLHLDTPFKGLSQINSELAKKIRNATFKAFEKIVDVCIAERVDFLLIAGDIFDGELKSLGAQLAFVDQLKRLSKENISAYFICGNHDPLCSWMEVLDFPENVFRFQSDAIQKITYCKDGRPLADIYGMSYQDKAITQNISYLYKIEEARSPFSIAMLHGNLTGNTTHDNYAPFTLLDLQNTQFNYWALGHVHARQVLSDKFPAIVYPGNPQGRDFGERSSKGCYLVELTTNENPKLTFIPTQLIRFEQVPIDLSGSRDFTSLSDAITNGIDAELSNEDSIIRIILTGRTPLHSQLQSDQNSLLEHLNSDAFVRSPFRLIDRIHVNTSPEIDFEQLKQAGDFAGELIKQFDQVQENTDANEWFSSITNEIANAQIRRELSSLSEHDKKQIIEDAKYDLLDQFINE